MRKLFVALIAAICSLAFAARAQDTNALKTEIGLFESQTGEVIIKGFGQIGSVATGAAVISVRCKESASAATGHKDYGIAIEIDANQWRKLAIVDYDELDALLNGMDYLGKMTYNVTSLPGFEATFTTKSGLEVDRLSATSSRAASGLTCNTTTAPEFHSRRTQWTQLVNLIAQAKTTIDSLSASQVTFAAPCRAAPSRDLRSENPGCSSARGFRAASAAQRTINSATVAMLRNSSRSLVTMKFQ